VSAPKTAIFYGWWVVLASFAVMFVGFGCTYTFSAFVGPLQREFAASRGSVSLVFSLAAFLYFSLGVVSGPLADRYGARAFAALGMLFLGAGLVLAGLARTLTEVYVAYGLGVGVGVGISYVPVLGAVQRWFLRRRGFASGLAVSGIGMGTLVMPALATRLIEWMGWRDAYFALGAFAVVVGVSLSLLIERDPKSRGLEPDGDPPKAQPGPKPGTGMSVTEAVRSRRFVVLYLSCLSCALGIFVPFVHLAPYAIDHGVSPTSAALLVGMIGIGSTAGRFFLGGVADRMGRERAMLATFFGMACSLGLWEFSEAFWSLALFACIYGVFYGGWVAILPTVVMDSFGGRNVGAIIGLLYTSAGLGTLIGPSAAGFIFDASKSYAWPIAASVAANVLAAGIMAFYPRALKPV
jgi:MFS family permease